MYEVELKFPLNDPDAFVARLVAAGAKPGPAVDQCDLYFNHPARDFEQTDEAFRIRSIGDRHHLTYKGAVVDSQTKTRREIEVGLQGAEAFGKTAEMLRFLGFRPVREVRKHRQTYGLLEAGRKYEITVDAVDGLGLFAEVETLADEAGKAAAVAAILALVEQFRLPPPERKSYLQLLIEVDRETTPKKAEKKS